jgi:hypothetical protein
MSSGRSGAKAIERSLENWLDVAGVAVDGGDGDDHVEDLFEREIVTDLVGALCDGKERSASGEHPGSALAENRVAPVSVREQLGSDVVLGGREGEEPVQPGHPLDIRSIEPYASRRAFGNESTLFETMSGSERASRACARGTSLRAWLLASLQRPWCWLQTVSTSPRRPAA